MIDWLTVLIALAIIVGLIGGFAFFAWKITMPDPLTTNNKDDGHQTLFDSVSTIDKKKKDKTTNEQAKKKQKERKNKKSKREQKEEQQQPQQQQRRGSHNTVTFKEPSSQTSEESDDEREESEQESSTPPPAVVETASSSSKARKRNKNKPRTASPPPANLSSSHIEGILANKNEKSLINTARVIPVTQLKTAATVPKDEVELARQHAKTQFKAQPSTATAAAATAAKKTQPSSANQEIQKPQQQQEQPFTTVVSNRHKAGTPPLQQQQQQQQQQQTKPVNVAPSASSLPVAAPVQVQSEPLGQRPPPLPPRQQPLQQKETPSQMNGFASKPQIPAAPTKVADLIKALPTSQAVVTELMSAFDAFPLSTDELDIVMQKIANKQSVLKQDWNKLQHGQKVDPQAHIGQVKDASAKAYEEDMKNNALIRVNELTNELHTDKRRINDLLKEKTEKDLEIQMIRTQLDSIQQQSSVMHPQLQHQLQSLQLQLQRLTEENNQLKHQLTQQQQQQPHIVHGNDETTRAKVNMLTDHVRTLSVRNGELEKIAVNNERLVKEIQKEKDDLIRRNQQLIQKTHEMDKQIQHNEEKLRNDLNETRTLHLNQINDYQRRIQQLEFDNEQLRREDIVHVEPTTTSDGTLSNVLNNEERERFERELNALKQADETNRQRLDELNVEKQTLNQRIEQINQEKQRLNEEFEEYKRKIEIQSQLYENELRQEIDRLKQELENGQQVNVERRQIDESHASELAEKTAQIDALRAELDEAKAKNDDFDQWLSSYRQIFLSNTQTLQEECATFKRENDQLHKNMNEVENQLKEIERTVQSKEELLLIDLKSKDATVESLRAENDQSNAEMQRLHAEIDRLQMAHDAAATEARALKLQLDERFLVAVNSPSVVADESFELIKQPTPSSSPIGVDIRAEQLNELIRSGKEALENQDSLVQELGRHLNDMHRGSSGTGETSTDNVNESTVPSSSDQQQSAS